MVKMYEPKTSLVSIEPTLHLNNANYKSVCIGKTKVAMVSKYTSSNVYENVYKSFRTGRPERELQTVQLSATRCSCIAILWVSLVSFAYINLCVASQLVLLLLLLLLLLLFISLSTQSGNVWIHPRTYYLTKSIQFRFQQSLSITHVNVKDHKSTHAKMLLHIPRL
jgi:hypothetical protein